MQEDCIQKGEGELSKVLKQEYRQNSVAGFTHRTAMEEAARCLLCHDAPCSKGCPAGTDPAKFIRSIRFRNVKGAAETIRENNIMGGTCAHVCPYDRLCEEACSRCGIDKPIEIGRLQRYAIEQEKVFGMETLKVSEEKKPEKIACIGAGPASLACAAELAKNGYSVTIYEREEKAGGVLTYGIVPSRLPQEVVDHDIAQVEKLGVEFRFGKEVAAEYLTDYDAVFVGAGLWGTNIPDIQGTDLKGVYSASEYLKKAKTCHLQDTSANCDGCGGTVFDPGKRVVVIGGGDVTVDCAVTAKLLGAEDVKIVYRRTIEEAPGSMSEFQYALRLGIGITTGMAPAAIQGNGKVEHVIFTGFRDEHAALQMSADTVIFATGQKAEMAVPEAEHIFAAGDIVNGGKTVVEAVAGGKEAAAAIMEYLQKGAK